MLDWLSGFDGLPGFDWLPDSAPSLTVSAIALLAVDFVVRITAIAVVPVNRRPSSALAWLLTILRNTNANMHRRQRPGTISDWELIRTARPAFGRAELPSAEDSFVDHELHADLDAAVRALDPRFRAALILVDVHDLSYSEAAAVMGVPVGTVMSRLSRARDRVRKSLRFSPLTRGDLS